MTQAVRVRKIRTRLLWGMALALVLFLAWNAVFLDVLAGVPFSRAYAGREGRIFHIFLSADEKYRLRTPLANFPPALVEAVLLQEGRYFYGHWGINPGAMFRAGWETYVKKRPYGGIYHYHAACPAPLWPLYPEHSGKTPADCLRPLSGILPFKTGNSGGLPEPSPPGGQYRRFWGRFLVLLQ